MGCCEEAPGLEVLDEAKNGTDGRPKAKKLYLLPKKKERLNQTSHVIQILIHDSDPDYPDPKDIAKVTDYVVGYSTKTPGPFVTKASVTF